MILVLKAPRGIKIPNGVATREYAIRFNTSNIGINRYKPAELVYALAVKFGACSDKYFEDFIARAATSELLHALKDGDRYLIHPDIALIFIKKRLATKWRAHSKKIASFEAKLR
jgi:hypothetical protein